MTDWWLVSYLALWALVAAMFVVLLVVLRQLGLIYLRTKGGGLSLDEGPALGSIMTPFHEMDDEQGVEFRFPSAETAISVLLFTSSECPICKEVLRGVSALVRHHDVSVVVLSDGTREQNRELRALVDGKAHFATNLRRQQALGVESIPYAIAVNETGVVLEKKLVNHLDDLEDLLERANSSEFVGQVARPAY